MFGLSPFDMMMYEQPSSSYYTPASRSVYVPSSYRQQGPRYVYPSVSSRYGVPQQQHADVTEDDEDDDELAEYVARVRAAEQARLQAELELQRQQQQLAQAKKAAYLRALEQERQQRQAQQAAYYQAILAERQRRQQLYEQQMKLREEQMRYELESQQQQQQQQQRQLDQEKRARSEDEVKREFLSQLLGEMFGQQFVLRTQPSKQQAASTTPAAKPSSAQQMTVKTEAQVNQPSSVKQQAAPVKTDIKAATNSKSSFFIPVRVISSAESSDKSSSSVTSRVSVPLTVNTSPAPASPVEIEDEPITPDQWNLDPSDVVKADRVHTPSPSEPSSPKLSTKNIAVTAAENVSQSGAHASAAGRQVNSQELLPESQTQGPASQVNDAELSDSRSKLHEAADIKSTKINQSSTDSEWEKVESH